MIGRRPNLAANQFGLLFLRSDNLTVVDVFIAAVLMDS